MQLTHRLGNRGAARAMQRVGTIVQRDPLTDKRQLLKDAEAVDKSTLSKSSRRRHNAKIRKLKAEIEALTTGPSANGSKAPEQAVATPAVPEPETPKKPEIFVKQPTLEGVFDAETAQKLSDAVSEETLGALIGALGATELKNVVAAFTVEGMAPLMTGFTAPQLADSVKALGATNLEGLVKIYSAPTTKNLLGQVTLDVAKDIFTQFTPATFNTFVTAVGGSARFLDLTKTKKLKATALKKYGAPFLKKFVGAGATTIAHLLDIKLKNDGTISGGHDEDTFYGLIDTVIGSYEDVDRDGYDYTVTVYQGKAWRIQSGSNYTKVGYKTFDRDGYDWGRGSKTLITNLDGQKAAWQKKVNEALWNAIAAETFDLNSREWTATANDGSTFSGFYVKTEAEVRTFFPTS